MSIKNPPHQDLEAADLEVVNLEALDLGVLREALTRAAVPSDAAPMAAYMKDKFPFLGIKAKPRRDAARPTMAAGKTLDGDELLDFADACWAEPEREFQHVAADMLRSFGSVLGPEHLERVETLIVSKAWWDTVDVLAVHVVGPLVARSPELGEVMDCWIDDPDFWVARSAILHQLNYGADTDAERLFRYSLTRAADTEFFLRKAIGWALRQHARHDPDAVQAFVSAHAGQLSGLTKKEALKHLS